MCLRCPQCDCQRYVWPEQVVIFAKTSCPFCKEVIALFTAPPYSTVPYRIVQLDRWGPTGEAMQDWLLKLTGARSVPRVFVDGALIGGCDQTKAAHASAKLMRQLFGGAEKHTTLCRWWRCINVLLAVVVMWLWRRRLLRLLAGGARKTQSWSISRRGN